VTLRDPARLLSAWDAAAGLPRAARGASLADAALDLPISDAAALALQAYADAFGATADCVLECPACGQELDVSVPLAELDARGGGEAAVAELTVRAPTTRDLLAARDGDELLARCVSEDGAPVDPAALDGERRDAVDAAAEDLAGLAAIVVRAECPDCGAEASAPLDPGLLLWERVASAVPAALGEVAELALAFGWSEREVLALTPLRRRAYLELARGGR
jgi:hypothetical protein